jgi:hypothetical protein
MDRDKDADLKERFARVLFSNGAQCRFNVEVVGGPSTTWSSAEQAEKAITDVDVFCHAHGPFFEPLVTVADCKSGRTGKPRERLLWLAGLRDRYRANAGYFVKKDVEPSVFLDDFKSLGLSLLSSKTLEAWEILSASNRFETTGPVAEGASDLWLSEMRRLAAHSKEDHRYVSGHVWMDAPGARLESSLAVCQRLRPTNLDFARVSTLALFSQAALTLTGELNHVSPSKRANALPALLLGQGDFHQQRTTMDAVHKFVKAEVEKQGLGKWQVSREAFRDLLNPPFANDLLGLMGRLAVNPASRYLPQVLDSIAFEIVEGDRSWQFADLMRPPATVSGLHQAAVDIVSFATRNDALHPTQAYDIVSRIGK